MNQLEFEQLHDATWATCRHLLIVKGAEYAGTEDRLSNFKRGSKLTGATPLQVAFIYASKHYDSISTFIRNQASDSQAILSEPIEGRLDDLINYCILMKAIIQEMKHDTVTQEFLTHKDLRNLIP